MFSFDLISDFHVEMNPIPKDPYFYNWKKEQQSDTLVIAGDTGNNLMMSTAVITDAARVYKNVVVVDGNHEHYGWGDDGNTHVVVQKMATYFNHYVPNVKMLHGKNAHGFQTNDRHWLYFVGGNGWYDFNWGTEPNDLQRMAWMNLSNDRKIKFYDEPQNLARYAARNLANKLDTLHKKDNCNQIVVVTHTVPLDRFIIHKPNDIMWTRINGAYYNSHMQSVFENGQYHKIKAWVFGHSHISFDQVVDDVRFVSNPRGYHGERRDGGQRFEGIKQICIEEEFPSNK